MAGSRHADVDVLMLYDSFTITVLLQLEDLGFCPKGEGGRSSPTASSAPAVRCPPTPHRGGGLSYTHPGQYGMFLLVEAVRQSGRRRASAAGARL